MTINIMWFLISSQDICNLIVTMKPSVSLRTTYAWIMATVIELGPPE